MTARLLYQAFRAKPHVGELIRVESLKSAGKPNGA
jgi:hypothetical protein